VTKVTHQIEELRQVYMSKLKTNAQLASKKSLGERILHAIGFEALAVMISAPIAAWLLNKSMFEMGTLAILLSTTAMLWNIVYNSIFDRL